MTVNRRKLSGLGVSRPFTGSCPGFRMSRPSSEESCLVWACHDRQQKEAVRFGHVTTFHRRKLSSLGTSRPSTEGSCPVWARHDRLQKEAVRFGHVTTVNRRKLSGLGTSRPSEEGSCPGLDTSQLGKEGSCGSCSNNEAALIGACRDCQGMDIVLVWRRRISRFRYFTRHNHQENKTLLLRPYPLSPKPVC